MCIVFKRRWQSLSSTFLIFFEEVHGCCATMFRLCSYAQNPPPTWRECICTIQSLLMTASLLWSSLHSSRVGLCRFGWCGSSNTIASFIPELYIHSKVSAVTQGALQLVNGKVELCADLLQQTHSSLQLHWNQLIWNSASVTEPLEQFRFGV